MAKTTSHHAEVICDLGIPKAVLIGGTRRAVTARAGVISGQVVRVMLDVKGLKLADLAESRFAIERGVLVQLVDEPAAILRRSADKRRTDELKAIRSLGAVALKAMGVSERDASVSLWDQTWAPVPSVSVLVFSPKLGAQLAEKARAAIGARGLLFVDFKDGKLRILPSMGLRELFARSFDDHEGVLERLLVASGAHVLSCGPRELVVQPGKGKIPVALWKRVEKLPSFDKIESRAGRRAIDAGKRGELTFLLADQRPAPPWAAGKMSRRPLLPLPLPAQISLPGERKKVPLTSKIAVRDNGVISIELNAPGLLAAVNDGDFVSLAVKDGQLVRVVDVAAREEAAAAATRLKQARALVKKSAFEVARVTNGKPRADDVGEVPSFVIAGRKTRDELLALQARFDGSCVVTAAQWTGGGGGKADGIRVLPAWSPGAVVAAAMDHPFANYDIDPDELARVVDALVDEAGCRLLHVSADTLVLWPTKKPGAMPKSKRALKNLVYEGSSPADAAVSAVAAAKRGQEIFFWWD